MAGCGRGCGHEVEFAEALLREGVQEWPDEFVVVAGAVDDCDVRGRRGSGGQVWQGEEVQEDAN